MRELLNTVLSEWGNTGDGVSGSILLASLMDMLPTIAALLSIIWFLLRIYESETVQRLIYGPRRRKDNDE